MAKKYIVESGYKGRFGVDEHKTVTTTGKIRKHFDLRLEMKTLSLRKTLKSYLEKRLKPYYKRLEEIGVKTKEPLPKVPDRSGNVLRSFAIPKARLPIRVNEKLMATETEPHDIGYLTFEGEIGKPEEFVKDPKKRKRLYGEGWVKKWDIGKYELLDVDYDKKYVFKLDGRKNKADGIYALVKFKPKEKAWLLMKLSAKKEKEYREKKSNLIKNVAKRASLIDYPRRGLSPAVWTSKRWKPVLKDHVKWFVVNNLFNILRYYKLRFPNRWVYKLTLAGSLVTNHYKVDSDFDVNVEIDYRKFCECNRELDFRHPLDIRQYLRRIVYRLNGMLIPGTRHPLKFFVISRGHLLQTDFIYDILSETWETEPESLYYDPDELFWVERERALEWVSCVNDLLSKIEVATKDLKEVEDFLKEEYVGEFFLRKKNALASRLRNLLNCLRKVEEEMHEVREYRMRVPWDRVNFVGYRFSKNWAAGNIIFKYLERYLGEDLFKKLYDRLRERDLIEIVKRYAG